MQKILPRLLSILPVLLFLQPFHTKNHFKFESESSRGTAGILYFHDQIVDTISLDRLQTDENSALYITFVRYEDPPPYDWDAVYGGEGAYRIFHEGKKLPEKKLPQLTFFSSPRLLGNIIVYWGFVGKKVYGFRTNLNTLHSDSLLLFHETIATDYRYAFDFPIPKDNGRFLFRTFAVDNDSLLVDFDRSTVKDLN